MLLLIKDKLYIYIYVYIYINTICIVYFSVNINTNINSTYISENVPISSILPKEGTNIQGYIIIVYIAQNI